MTIGIIIPSRFEDLIEDSTKLFRVALDDVMGISEMADSELMIHVDELGTLIEEEDGLSNFGQNHIDFIYSTLNELGTLSSNINRSFSSVIAALGNLAVNSFSSENYSNTQNQSRIILYFCQVYCQKMETVEKSKPSNIIEEEKKQVKQNPKVKKSLVKITSSDFHWDEQRSIFLDIIIQTLSINPALMWEMGVVQDNFLLTMWKIALQLLEDRPFDASSGVAQQCIEILVNCTQRFNLSSSCSALAPLSTAIMNSIAQSPNINAHSKDIADVCKTAHSALLATLLGDFGAMNMTEKAKVKNVAKNLNIFMVRLAEVAPDRMSLYLSLIKEQLDCEVHIVRNTILEVMGKVAVYIYKRKATTATGAAATSAHETTSTTSATTEMDPNYDPSEESRHTQRLSKLYDSILAGALLNRIHDVNSHTRSATLHIWSELVEEEVVEKSYFGKVAGMAVDRLFDKAVLVRKAAVSLLTVMLDHNPFGGDLDLTFYQAKASELHAGIVSRCNDLVTSRSPSSSSTATPAQEPKDTAEEVDDEGEEGVGEDEEDVEPTEEEVKAMMDQDSTVQQLTAELSATTQARDFLLAVHQATEKIKAMIHSKTSTDVLEALRFFSRAVNFGISGSMLFLRSTFSLIWHQDDAIKKQCLETFKNVFLTDGAAENPRLSPPHVVAYQLNKLVKVCDCSSLASLEQILDIFIAAKVLPIEVIGEEVMDAIWMLVKEAASASTSAPLASATATASDPVMSDMASSLHLAAMITKSKPETVTASRVRCLIAGGLSGAADHREDFEAVTAAAKCLQSFSAKKIDESTGSTSLAVAVQEAVPALQRILSGGGCGSNEEDTRRWFGAAEECMYALFAIHTAPEKMAAQILSYQYKGLGSVDTAADAASVAVVRLGVPAAVLSQFLFTIGQTVICTLLLTENLAKEAKKSSEKQKAKESTGDISETTAAAAAVLCTPQHGQTPDYPLPTDSSATTASMEEEMGMAAAADAEHDKLLEYVLEQDIMLNKELLFGKLHPLVAYIVADEGGQFQHPLLRETAIFALCRLMGVSSLLCELYLPLIFTVLESRKLSAQVRTTIIIAVGDLAFRFPNALEPWTARMYNRLGDTNAFVRYNTLMVLTHLILNDMIKVKGQVSQMVLCLSDPEESVKGLAALFFTELSKRSNNPVYNLLGDIIGSLSGSTVTAAVAAGDLTEEVDAAAAVDISKRVFTTFQFQEAMTFMLKFVTKDKQADSLLERLILRMEVASGSRQLRNLAFCVSQLPITEKGVRKMVEMSKHYKDALHDEEVRSYFMAAATKCQRGLKEGDTTRNAVAEFESFVLSVVGGEGAEGDGRLLAAEEEEGTEEDAALSLSLSVSQSRQLGGKATSTATGAAGVTKKKGGIEKKASKKKSKKSVASRKQKDWEGEEEEEGEEDVSDLSEEDVTDENDASALNRAKNSRSVPKKGKAGAGEKAANKVARGKSNNAATRSSRKTAVASRFNDDDDEMDFE